MTDQPKHASGPGAVPAWATYLASSWTWCIGMFLPVLLLRDYGVAGFGVFAAPNVAGAALMGWVLAGRGQSERFVAAHSGACILFSLVTIAFQVFFLTWLVNAAVPIAGPALLVTGTAAALVALLGRRGGLGPLGAAALAYAVSIAVIAVLLWRGGLTMPQAKADAMRDLLWLAPVCVFGFAFCPYLDLTFHRARRSLAGPAGTAAFVLGFGVLFFAMILFTAGYAASFEPMAAGLPLALGHVVPLVCVHMVAQLTVTCDLHGRELAAISASSGRAMAIGAVVVGGLIGLATPLLPTYAGLTSAEVVYRCFMAFYGLVFPAYVWLCVLTGSGPTRRATYVWAFAVGIAAPMFWMGFIERQEAWLAPGLLIVLLARFAVPRPAPAAQPAS